MPHLPRVPCPPVLRRPLSRAALCSNEVPRRQCLENRSGLSLLHGNCSGASSPLTTFTKLNLISRVEDDLRGVVTIELQNPKANALGNTLVSELEEAVQRVGSDESIRTVIFSSGVHGVFCAGADLKERASMSIDEAEAFVNRLRDLMDSIASIPAPTIAAVEGAAFGGGLELMLACDLRVAGANMVTGLTETSLGIIPGAGGTQRLPRLIGASAAKEMVFTARRVSAVRALELGIVGTLVDAGKAEDEALATARDIAARGPLAVRLAKQAIDAGMQVRASEGMKIERELYGRVLRSRDRNEGLEAFGERRLPNFTGK